MKKRLLSLLLALTMVLTMLPVTALADDPVTYWTDEDNYDTSWFDGEGKQSPYIISTAAELAGLAVIVARCSPKYVGEPASILYGETIKLAADIDLSEHYWVPIGNGNSDLGQFQGTFDGTGHKVTGMKIEGAYEDAGLFGKACTPQTGIKSYGITSEIRNLSVSGTIDVEISSGALTAGMLVGDECGCNIVNCYATGTINATVVNFSGNKIPYIGGLVGYGNSGAALANGQILNCYANCTLSTETERSIIGALLSTNCTCFVRNCYTQSGELNVIGESHPNSSTTQLLSDLHDIPASQMKAGAGEVPDDYDTWHDIPAGTANGKVSLTEALNVWVDAQAKEGNNTYYRWVAGVEDGYPGFGERSTTSWTAEGNYDADLYKSSVGNWKIYDAADLAALSKKVSENNTFSGMTVTLEADIDLSGHTWEPIGPDLDYDEYIPEKGAIYLRAFLGTFDGKGHKITGMNVIGNYRYAGLFGCVATNAIIQNVDVSGTVTAYYTPAGNGDRTIYVAGLVGDMAVGRMINCSMTGDVSCYVYGENGEAFVGGLTGHFVDQIKDCHAKGTVTGYSTRYAYVGGLVGNNLYGVMENSYSCTDVVANTNFRAYAGGIIGYNEGCTIVNGYATGDVTANGLGDATTANVGGIAGMNKCSNIADRAPGNIINCYATGDLKVNEVKEGTCSANIGGIAGTHETAKRQSTKFPKEQNGFIENCYMAGSISSNAKANKSNIGCIVGDSSSGVTKNCYGLKDNSNNVYGKGTADATNYALPLSQMQACPNEKGGNDWVSITVGEENLGTVSLVDALSKYVTKTPKYNARYIKIEGAFTDSGTDNNNRKDFTLLPWSPMVSNGCPGFAAASSWEDGVNFGDSMRWKQTSTFNEVVVTTPNELAELSKRVKDDFPLGNYTVILGADIDLSGHNWEPIGGDDQSSYFLGTFDGAGHKITGMNVSGKYQYAGLFGIVGYGAIIKNLTVEGTVAAYNDDDIYVGGVASYNKGTIINCESKVTVIGKTSGASKTAYVGGLVGKNDTESSDNSNIIRNCYVTGDVTGGGANYYVGGVLGYMEQTGNRGNISNCYATGKVSGSGTTGYVGGVAGAIIEQKGITNCYAISQKDAKDAAMLAVGNAVTDNESYSMLPESQMKAAAGAEPTEEQAEQWKQLTVGSSIFAKKVSLIDALKEYVKKNPKDVYKTSGISGLVRDGTVKLKKWMSDSSGYPTFVPHTHEWTVSASGATLTAVCGGGEKCSLYDKSTQTATLTLTLAERYFPRGFDKDALDTWVSEDLQEPVVEFKKKTEQDTEYSSIFPNATGSYTAQATVTEDTDYTVVCDFDIEKHSVTVVGDGSTAQIDGKDAAQTLEDVLPGTKVKLSAPLHITITDDEGTEHTRQFVGWTADNLELENEVIAADDTQRCTAEFTMLNSDVFAVAEYKDCYALVVGALGAKDNITVDITQSKLKIKGLTITIQAPTPPTSLTKKDPTYRFAYWEADGFKLKGETDYTRKASFGTTMPENAITLTAHYAIPHAITVTNGTITKVNGEALQPPVATTTAVEGDVITIQAAEPGAGGECFEWVTEDVTLESKTATETTFTMPDEAAAVAMTYKVTPPTKLDTVPKFTFNGKTQTYTFKEDAGRNVYYTVENDKKMDAGEYTVTAKLNDTTNTIWNDTNDTTDKTFNFKIERKAVPRPTGDPRTYLVNGKEQEYRVLCHVDGNYYDYTDVFYTVKGNKQTSAGTYAVIATPLPNYKWDVGTELEQTVSLEFKFTIESKLDSYIRGVEDKSGTLYGYFCPSYYRVDNDNPSHLNQKLKDFIMPRIEKLPADAKVTYYICDDPQKTNSKNWEDVLLMDMRTDAEARENKDYYMYARISCDGVADYETPITEESKFTLIKMYSRLGSYKNGANPECRKVRDISDVEEVIEGIINDLENGFNSVISVDFRTAEQTEYNKSSLDMLKWQFRSIQSTKSVQSANSVNSANSFQSVQIAANGALMSVQESVQEEETSLEDLLKALGIKMSDTEIDPFEEEELPEIKRFSETDLSLMDQVFETLKAIGKPVATFENDDGSTGTCCVTFHYLYKDAANSDENQSIVWKNPGEKLNEIVTPTQDDMIFDGWYYFVSDTQDSESQLVIDWEGQMAKWDMENDMIVEDVELYARWKDKNGTDVEVDIEEPEAYAYPVKLAKNIAHGQVKANKSYAALGEAVTITITPEAGYELATLTVHSSKGNDLVYTERGNSQYVFKMPSSVATISATFRKTNTTSALSRFTDIEVGAWYIDGIDFCVEKGLMKGVSENLFAPKSTTTRAMIVTILWRLAGEPKSAKALTFKDAAAGSWYEAAVRWATEKEIVKGYSDQKFGPDDPITREQLAAILYRYAQKLSGSSYTAKSITFADAVKISSWAKDAVSWCSENGIVNGKNGNIFDPQGKATRAEAAAMVQRFCAWMEK